MTRSIRRITALFFIAFGLCVYSSHAADSLFVGSSFNGTTVTPTGSYISDRGSGIYLITSYQVTRITLQPAIAFQTTTTQDVGYDFSSWLPMKFQKRLSLVGIGGAGASASSTALAGAFEGGGIGLIHTPHFDVVLGAKILRTAQSGTQTVPIAGIRFNFN